MTSTTASCMRRRRQSGSSHHDLAGFVECGRRDRRERDCVIEIAGYYLKTTARDLPQNTLCQPRKSAHSSSTFGLPYHGVPNNLTPFPGTNAIWKQSTSRCSAPSRCAQDSGARCRRQRYSHHRKAASTTRGRVSLRASARCLPRAAVPVTAFDPTVKYLKPSFAKCAPG